MKQKKILIVDDEPNILMSLEYAFKKKDFEVFIARDGTEAIEISNREKPNLILLDIMMPEMDGYETLKQVKDNEDLAHTKIVFLSAKSKEKDVEKGLKMGADRYLTKPFSMKKVISEIEELLA
ncbi:MAG: response regulator transcription factor [Allomuricauda sp.]|jgi:DNA-binding response OmpR family regulator|uniref:response regulator transcription factor n=1 Tax=Allomuricauda sp. ARW1Y1 TaxID=2663843 RepID=UPI0015CB164F|nr:MULTISPECIES: response regulator [unclassified Allomuricauda]MBO6531844.1 response regulator [Allomuricauda sp.]MBO6589795.1 response regulator [Allomuricauda sp.]MBO6619272.1 response regulator [Allomuricauda sp.]MBO6645183.1 response regulator [Allomuricauda sp.]MBO6747541.1 response regulator [Allomuricauda sp.]